MNSHGPRVAVVYNEPFLRPEHPDWLSDCGVVGVAQAVSTALAGSGFVPVLLAACPPLSAFLDRLTESAPDLVFNLIEGFGGSSGAEPHVASVFELLGIPYTGSPVEALVCCRSKAHAKALLRGYGLPTAPFVVVDRRGPIPAFEGRCPVMVKPEAEDASLGIDQESVVTDPASIADRVERLRVAYDGPVLIETYLPGPEFYVGLIATPETRTLPIAQVVYADRPGLWPILTYAAKWDEGSFEDVSSPVICPAPVEPELAGRLGSLALAAFRATGCRDYARVDFRLDDRGEPMILEVNPNPDLGRGSGWARSARVAGIEYHEAVGAIARQAIGRGKH